MKSTGTDVFFGDVTKNFMSMQLVTVCSSAHGQVELVNGSLENSSQEESACNAYFEVEKRQGCPREGGRK